MKKTIIALLSLSCTAFADMTDGLVAWWTFDGGSTTYTSYTNFTSTVQTGLAVGNMHLTGGVDGNGYISSHYTDGEDVKNMDFYDGMGSMNISASAFTLSFKVNGVTADYRSIFSMTIGDHGQVNMQTENSNNGSDTCLYALEDSNSIEITNDAARTALQSDEEWVNVILTGNGTTLTLYVNGSSASVAYTPGTDTKLSNFQLGSQWGDGTRRVTANFDDLALWNRTLTADEISLLSKGAIANGTVPEPTTATLSLLALAGLAARRRRK